MCIKKSILILLYFDIDYIPKLPLETINYKIILTPYFTYNPMMRQSQIANFLDLIKHITQSRDFKNSVHHKQKCKQDYKNTRYRETECEGDREGNEMSEARNKRKSLDQRQVGKSSLYQTQFGHKMLKITHEIKRKPKYSRYQNLSPQKITNSSNPNSNNNEVEINEKVNRIRSNLYENYCQMIQKKRQQKLNRIFRNSQPDITNPIYNISETVHFQNQVSPAHGKLKQMPFIKSKTLKPGLQSIKAKIFSQKQGQKYEERQKKSKKKMQPQQLSIQAMKGLKMPKIKQYRSNPIQKKINSRLSKNYQFQFKSKKMPMNKFNNFDGWAMQQEDKNYPYMDQF